MAATGGVVPRGALFVRFTRDFRWSPPEYKGRVSTSFKAGMQMLVRRICGEAAIRAGAAVEVAKPTRAGDGGAN